MTGIPLLGSSGSNAASRATERATLVISKAIQETKKEAAAMVRLIEAADASGKGQHVDYRA